MIAAPNKKQLLNLRLMILIGVTCMIFFAGHLFKAQVIGNKPLYYLLVITFVFTAAKILYEWYHYWAITINATPPAGKAFTVDIFTTFCAGEPYEMIVETLEALQKITYPHETYLCDEADDPYLKEVCRKLGVHHITRKEKIDAKAGNINNALKHAKGELCVVLDPDHVPFPDFLDPIVNHFNNPEVGYVQIVQAYFNQDQGWIAKGAAQQTYQYYGPMMMTMNAYGTAQAIGANCTFRRTALDSIGGHAAGLAEDMHTSMQMHARGWKSVYVPAVLSRGLVPATLSAYYKQQLKWSRGVFELLVTSYVQLFRKFTWRQKLHYALVPMFYLSGFIYLLNFIIPIISLLADVYPLRMDFSEFTVISIPFLTSVILIRHYVQRWVMEDQERGFHVIGGLLLIGTWWVFIVGFVYTIIRKKVPYIPTPKDVSEERNLGVNMPNIMVLVLSLCAIGYGLYNDWNPFTFIMAGICLLNCFFMTFMLVASNQHKVKSYQKRHQRLSAVSSNIGAFKRRFWLLRRKLYTGVRRASLLLILLSVCIAAYITNRSHESVKPVPLINHRNLLLTGIFDPPAAGDGITRVSRVTALQSQNNVHFDLVSVYIPWGDAAQCNVPAVVMDSIYRNQSTPMITWEPWQNLFKANTLEKDEHVFAQIARGKYDNYIIATARQLRALNRPVFLRFAHEADNPFYPWSARGGNTAEDFKTAWRYVHDLFTAQGTWNVIWVWNPWNADAAPAYFPGKAYVDWIGVTGLNYGRYGTDGKTYSFSQLYMPFHKLAINAPGTPVMIAEMGAARDGQPQAKWLNDGVKSIKQSFNEIKAIVLFNSAFDKNVPARNAAMINWRQDSLNLLPAFAVKHNIIKQPAANLAHGYAPAKTGLFATGTRGVIYQKGQNWYGNQYAITRHTILKDFNAMRQTGISWVKVYGPGIYDHITFQAARETGMQIFYSFWVPDPAAIAADSTYLPRLAKKIISTVQDLKDNKLIKCWNIANSPLEPMDGLYLQPELFYRRQAYINWLKHLVGQIKAADPARAVTVDVAATNSLANTAAMLRDQVPQIDALGLVLKDNLLDTDQISRLPLPYYFSSVSPDIYFKLDAKKAGTFMQNWQDQQSASGVTFDGLKDIWGRNKPAFYQLAGRWTADTARPRLPHIKILRPSLATVPGDVLPYFALLYKNGKWNLAEYMQTGLQFEWYQVRTDYWGTPLQMTLLTKGAYLNYTVPQHPELYRLYLVAAKGNDITMAHSILNIPLK